MCVRSQWYILTVIFEKISPTAIINNLGSLDRISLGEKYTQAVLKANKTKGETPGRAYDREGVDEGGVPVASSAALHKHNEV